MVLASAVDQEGDAIYPRKWNHKFIDMPRIVKSKQNTPSFTSEVITGLAAWGFKQERMLFILLGAAGPRIGEALGLEIDKHISQDRLTITIEQKVREGRVENRLKTENSAREIDLHPRIGALLAEFIGERKTGFLFCTNNGKPLLSSSIYRWHLHPALKQLGFTNPFTGDHKAGFHAFRRFRNTYLRNRSSCPPGLRKFWLGWGDADESFGDRDDDPMGDHYDKIKEDKSLRREWAERCGYGFELPSDVPMVPTFDGDSRQS
jgi:integrase